MSKTTLSGRQARLVLTSVGTLLLVQFWGGAVAELLMGKAVAFRKSGSPTCARWDTAPSAFWDLIHSELTLGAVVGGGLLVLAQAIWYLNRNLPENNSPQGQVPTALGDGSLSRRWLIALAVVAAFVLAGNAIAVLMVRRC